MSTQPLGGWLKDAREARGLTVAAIAAQTKIPPRHLEALERGDGWALPAFYQRAELRAVARVVGVDEQIALARLDTELTPVESPPAPSRPTPVRSQLVVAIIGMAVVVVGLAGWRAFERTAAAREGVRTAEPITVPPVVPLPSQVPEAATVETAAASDAPPITAAGPTELVIRTQPEGARVTVNGISRGESPVTIRHLEPGEKRIRVTMDGYSAIERSVTIDEGRRETIRIRLSSVNAGS